MNGTRNDILRGLLVDEPAFRIRQAEEALYLGRFASWADVTVFPKPIRERLASSLPWQTLSASVIRRGKEGDSWKALLRTEDGAALEAVLMRNARGHLTVCVSTQVGCAMGCAFCATGKMGLVRNLSADEIVDQVRFFRGYTRDYDIGREITNIVLMGMGEPFSNYEAVREALRVLSGSMSIGLSRITVSTVGIPSALSRMLEDPLWPNVRLAISLHSADEDTRKKIMPSTPDGFLKDLVSFAHAYAKRFPERRRHLTLEYLLLSGVNDSDDDVRKLTKLAHRMDRVRVNLIPYNATESGFSGSGRKTMERFREALDRSGVTVTVRKSRGGDIAAACGQLAGSGHRKTTGREQ